MEKTFWADPKNDISVQDCYFYHTMDIPNHGTIHGEWDLRGEEAEYLGNVDFEAKRVLEVGTASGHLCFTMEKMGAEVVAQDLSHNQNWDIVPYAGYDYEKHISERKNLIERLNNGYWFAHKAFQSRAKVLHGSVYEIADVIGQFDICVFCSILLHLRDPFLALQCVTKLVKETVVVTDMLPKQRGIRGRILTAAEILTGGRIINFLPNAKRCKPYETWWNLSPRLVSEFLQILGFANTEITFHKQLGPNNKVKSMYTVVGQR